MTSSYTYDSVGNVLTRTDPLNRTTTNTYDLTGQLITNTNGNGVTVTNAYDDAGNLTSITYPGGSISYGYDDLGRRTTMTDGTGTTTWNYDVASQITSVAAPNGTVSYAYDNSGRRTSMTLPGARTATYAYNAVGQLTSLTDWQNRVIGFTYNNDGQRTRVTRPNGLSTTYGYDGAGQLTSVIHGGGGLGTQYSYQYTLDAAGNRTAVAYGGGTESYTLDALNRVTGVTYRNGDTAGYTYDANGNWLTYVFNGQTVNSYTYDNADQMTSDGVLSYGYDQAGNLVSAGADSYTWTWANQLSGATVGGNSVSYSYDGNGLKVSETVGATTTTYIYDQTTGLPLLVDDGTNGYLHAGGLISQIDGANNDTYPLLDGLGSVRGLTNGAGTVTGSTDYAVFGSPRTQTGTASIFGFTGEPTDATTGNIYLRARHYAPSLGRFLSADTLQQGGPGTQGFNRYAYGVNNPMRFTDPTGRTVSDVLEKAKILDGLIRDIVELGAVFTPLLIAAYAAGPWGMAVGLMFLVLVFTKIAHIFIVVTEMLELVGDAFNHYIDVAPTDPSDSSDPNAVVQAPDESCSFRENIQNIVNLVNPLVAFTPDAINECVRDFFWYEADQLKPKLSTGHDATSDREEWRELATLASQWDAIPVAELCGVFGVVSTWSTAAWKPSVKTCDVFVEMPLGILATLAGAVDILYWSNCSPELQFLLMANLFGSLRVDKIGVPQFLDEGMDIALFNVSNELYSRC